MTRKQRPTMPKRDAATAELLAHFLIKLIEVVPNRDVRLHALLQAAAVTVAVTEEAENSGAAIELYRRLDAATAAVVGLMEDGVKLPLRK